MLDLHKLTIFNEVTRAGSFSDAAERLYLTQSAVSQHIRDLEVQLGQRLFERGRRGVRLTRAGEVLQGYSDQILRLLAEAEAALVDVDHIAAGRLSVGATPGVGVYLAPDWVQAWRGRWPQIAITLKTGTTDDIVAEVLARRLDFGLVEGELPTPTDHPLRSLTLAEIEQLAVVGFKHPFWDRDELALPELTGQALIVRQPGSQSRAWLDQMLRTHGLQVSIAAEFDSIESIKRAVAVGQCLTILPPYAVQTEVSQGLLRALPLGQPALSRTLRLIWDEARPLNAIARAFLAELADRYPALQEMARTGGGAEKRTGGRTEG
jgi:DNA-binding transcriptional LysR family regulator